MFEDYIQDSFSFYNLALSEIDNKNERSAKMFFRASVFCAASSLEAFVNFIGDTFLQGGTLEPIELAYINDKILELSPTKAVIEEKIKYHSIDNKIKFIIKKFNVDIDTSNSKEWSAFQNFKELRDSLIHPRKNNDEITIDDYKKKIKLGLNSNIEIMNLISKAIFKKKLRKKLLDLKL